MHSFNSYNDLVSSVSLALSRDNILRPYPCTVIIYRGRNVGKAVTRKLIGHVEVCGFECVKMVWNQPRSCLRFPPSGHGIAGDFPFLTF